MASANFNEISLYVDVLLPQILVNKIIYPCCNLFLSIKHPTCDTENGFVPF